MLLELRFESAVLFWSALEMVLMECSWNGDLNYFGMLLEWCFWSALH